MSSHEASELAKAAKASIDDVVSSNNPLVTGEVRAAVKRAQSEYAKRIDTFKDNLLRRMTKDKEAAGNVDPSDIVDLIFKKEATGRIPRVMQHLDDATRQEVKTEAMAKILQSASRLSDDPSIGFVFDGTSLLKTLNKFGQPTLKAMFGSQTTRELYRFGRAAQAASLRMRGFSGGIVAANVALSPIANLGKLIQIFSIAKYMASPTGFRHLTEGLEAKTFRGTMSALSRAAIGLGTIVEEQTKEDIE